MLVKCYGSTILGIDAMTITVEVAVSPGVEYAIVGLPDNAVRESLFRMASAFEQSGYKKPGKRVVVNLSPADIRKEGSAYDLPIAIGILAASEQIAAERVGDYLIMGELSLDGSILPIRGALPMAIKAREEGFKGFILPKQNAVEAAVVNDLEVYGVDHIRQVTAFLNEESELEPVQVDTRDQYYANLNRFDLDFSDVKGQEHVKRALEVSAAGGHNLLMIGAPGSGKTMLAKRMPGIVPPMTLREALETTKIHSVAGKMGSESGLLTRRPFRSPHHLASPVSIVGGGVNPQPGEISLAHNGILFLDELPEFPRSVLEILRQPLEDKNITIARVKYTIEYPCNFMLIASMNPCPCGFFNHPTQKCQCGQAAITRYMNRISGPLLDRIDMHIEVTPVAVGELASDRSGERSETIRQRVIAARNIQTERFKNDTIHTNAMMSSRQIKDYCPLDSQSIKLLQGAMERMNLSARAYDRIIKLSRTIADLDASPNITARHIAEAIQYRSLDRKMWGMK
ncbi:MAG: YifB family Mg chelatase-like AAA ATPase [Rikenellaceae bacterium]|jgi:magnesium chelatase family protein|nr:YifB family Mg chelatase-like AAA ATPase [Rikenellaceae bacterium]